MAEASTASQMLDGQVADMTELVGRFRVDVSESVANNAPCSWQTPSVSEKAMRGC
ncbi:MAG: hypothetical protein ACR5LC_03465 [Symbiopectobacterium sp.]